MEIQRWQPVGSQYYMEEYDEGDYVEYGEHKAVVENLEGRIKELEQEVDELRSRLRLSGGRPTGAFG